MAYEHAEKVLDQFSTCHVVVAPTVQDAQLNGCRSSLGERAAGFELFERIKLDAVNDAGENEDVELDVVVFDSGRAAARCAITSRPCSDRRANFSIMQHSCFRVVKL